jgi:hypothetical protein
MTEILKLDPARPYGEVHGASDWKFEQDGLPFNPDPDGELPVLAVEFLTDAQKAWIEKLARIAVAKAEAEKLLAEAAGEAITVRIPSKDDAAGVEKIDLAAWRAGKAKYRFEQVAEECRARWSKKPKDGSQARALIDSNGTADLSELR